MGTGEAYYSDLEFGDQEEADRYHAERAAAKIPLSYIEIANSILDFMESQHRIHETGEIDASVNWSQCKAITDLLSESAQSAIDDAVSVADERKHQIVPIVSDGKLRHDLEQLLRILLSERV